MNARRWSLSPLLVAFGAVVLVGIGLLVGALLIDGDDGESQGEPLSASSIGDATRGRQLFVSQGCANCHSYEGHGGSDAPELDFMQGKLSATDVADMSGTIWNHVPVMEAAFEAEEIPFPTFEENQMANLIAYLHGGGPPPKAPKTGEGEEDEEAMHEGGSEHDHSEHDHGDEGSAQ